MVLNGLPSSQARAEESERLMRLAFTAFDTRTVEPTEEAFAELPVWNGEASTVGVRLGNPLRVAGHKRAFDQSSTEIVYDGPLSAPIEEGQQLATLVITMEGRDEPITAPLIATSSVEKLGFMGKAVAGLSLKLGAGDDQ